MFSLLLLLKEVRENFSLLLHLFAALHESRLTPVDYHFVDCYIFKWLLPTKHLKEALEQERKKWRQQTEELSEEHQVNCVLPSSFPTQCAVMDFDSEEALEALFQVSSKAKATAESEVVIVCALFDSSHQVGPG